LVRVGAAEFAEQAERLLPVPARLVTFTGRMASVAETIARAGLLVFVADRIGQIECCRVLGVSIIGLTGSDEGLTEAVQRVGFTGLVTDLPEQ
jgi:hypothetical protein